MVSLYDKWKHTKVLKIGNPSSTDGVQVDCTITCFPEMDKNFKDIRFTRLDGTNIPYDLVSYVSGTSANVTLKLPANDTKIILHYGNSLVESASSPTSVYDKYSDVNNMAGWVGNVSASGSEIHVSLSGQICASLPFSKTYPWIVETKLRRVASSNSNIYMVIGNAATTSFSTLRNIQGYCDAGSTIFKAYNNGSPVTIYSSYVVGTSYIHKFIEKEPSKYNYYVYDSNKSLLGSATDVTYGIGGQVDPVVGLQICSGSGSWSCDCYISYVKVRKYVATIPTITVLTDNTPKYECLASLIRAIDFSVDVMSGTNPLTVGFTDLSVGTVTAWLWDFGDTITSTDQNPTHQYTSIGIYDVSLTVTIDGVDYTETKTRYINVLPVAPVTDFSTGLTIGTAYFDVQFTDLSTNTPIAWYWEFGDGQISRSQNPLHRYQHSGLYTVSLTATNAGGSDKETKVNYITVTVPPAPVANFSADDTDVTIPTTVNFTDLSTNKPITWLWDFGDGDTSIVQNPAHVYDTFSTYGVTLTVTNEGGSDSEIKTGYITVSYAGLEQSELKATETSYVLPIATTVETGKLMTDENDNFSGHIHSPTSVVNMEEIDSTVSHLDKSVWLPNARVFVTVDKNNNISNTYATVTSIVGKTGRTGIIGVTEPFYSVYGGGDKVALIGKVYFANNQPFPNVEAILYGYTYKQIVESNALGIFGDYYDPDTYYKLACISDNGIVYDSIQFDETGTDVYTIIVARRTKSNATFRQIHRKFV